MKGQNETGDRNKRERTRQAKRIETERDEREVRHRESET